jgi:TRAP-type C4-dicarboxylate transport system permease small subunit
LAVALSLPYAHANKSHISVEIFIRRFSRGTRTAIHLLVNLVLLGFFAVVCWRLFDYAWSSRAAGELTMNLELPKHLIVAVLGIGFLAFVLCILADVLKAATRREES